MAARTRLIRLLNTIPRLRGPPRGTPHIWLQHLDSTSRMSMDTHEEADVANPADTNRDFIVISDRLDHRASVIRRRTAARLSAVWEMHDLSLSELLATQATVAKMSEPATPAEFWAAEALPRAHALRDAATATIDDELEQFADAVARFHESLRLLARPQRDDELGRRGRLHALAAGHSLAETFPDKTINDVGARWHTKLHRAARRRSFFATFGVPPAEAELALARTEMELLSEAPWSHGDRMLSAFELAHSDIANHLRRSVVRVIDRHSWPTSTAMPRHARQQAKDARQRTNDAQQQAGDFRQRARDVRPRVAPAG